MEVLESPIDDPRWRELADTHPDAGPFHLPAWASLIADCYRFRAFALTVREGDEVLAGLPVVIAAFEFDFMGGSMGSVVGERFVRGVRVAVEQQMPFVCITATGGARMQEGLFSLMQMAKTTAAVTQLSAMPSPARRVEQRKPLRLQPVAALDAGTPPLA